MTINNKNKALGGAKFKTNNMALSDCAKCWNTPCSCGYEYKDYSKTKLAELVASIAAGYRDKNEAIEALEMALTILKSNDK